MQIVVFKTGERYLSNLFTCRCILDRFCAVFRNFNAYMTHNELFEFPEIMSVQLQVTYYTIKAACTTTSAVRRDSFSRWYSIIMRSRGQSI